MTCSVRAGADIEVGGAKDRLGAVVSNLMQSCALIYLDAHVSVLQYYMQCWAPELCQLLEKVKLGLAC